MKSMFDPPPPADTIPVRPEEVFDERKAADYLRGLLPGADSPMRVRQFGGGKANLTYLLQFSEREYVLRRPPLGPVPPSAHDMGREYKALFALHPAYPLAPRAFHFCADASVIGAPFLIMERRRGVVVRATMPPEFEGQPGAPELLAARMIDALADLHAVSYSEIGLDDLGKPAGFVQRQVEGWGRRWQNAKLEELPNMDKILAWLADHVPARSQFSVVHNDYKLDNVMFAANEPGRAVAVFDWDMCTLGDPLSDLGGLLAYWSEPEDPPHFKQMAMMPTRGFPSRQRLIELYCKRSGRDVDDIRFYHALGLFRVAVIIAQIYCRFRRGQTQDPRFERFGPLLPTVARAAWEVANGEAES